MLSLTILGKQKDMIFWHYERFSCSQPSFCPLNILTLIRFPRPFQWVTDHQTHVILRDREMDVHKLDKIDSVSVYPTHSIYFTGCIINHLKSMVTQHSPLTRLSGR